MRWSLNVDPDLVSEKPRKNAIAGADFCATDFWAADFWAADFGTSIKGVLFDKDGTSLDFHGTCAAANHAATFTVTEAGVERGIFAPSSGRRLPRFRPFEVRQYGLSKRFDYDPCRRDRPLKSLVIAVFLVLIVPSRGTYTEVRRRR